ncbi:MAG: DUF1800 domain-containing protein [Rhodospirillaceae bacterium]|nr:DUF1800 domain-containing protein [Rhodospirillaceae bacterium]
MSSKDATIAANRFGLGARVGDLSRIAKDPRGWLRAQCETRHETPKEVASLPGARRIYDSELRADAKNLYRRHAAARLLAAVNSETPFVERLVWFWSNHFTVSVQRRLVVPFAESFEREAIRPNVLGRFADMLLSAAGHPAMQYYLDNFASNGPQSYRRGNLNENLAREILELHTLGIDGGYTPRDIREFALMLTGWGVDEPKADASFRFDPNRLQEPASRPKSAAFAFDPDRHQPGPKWFMGKVYKGAGVREAEAALRDLAAHPSTARFLANKIARHFIADDPPPAATARLEKVFLRTGGDLRAIALAIISEPAAWQHYFSKVRTPIELIVSAARATGFHERDGERLFDLSEQLGQRPFDAQSPAGFPDRGEDWMGGQAVLERVDFCAEFAATDVRSIHPATLARGILGQQASAATLTAIRRAPSRAHAIGLMLASREFQRR